MVEPLRFVPSRVEGLPGVTEVTVRPDRLELVSEGRTVVVAFDDIAEWPRPRRMRKLLARLGLRPRWLPIGERDWFREPKDRLVRFYTTPPLTVYMPDEHGVEHEGLCFQRLRDVIALGGFSTHDLG